MNRKRLQSKCNALERKCARLEDKLIDAKRKIKLWRNRYLNAKRNVNIMPKTEICVYCGEQYRKDWNAWQNHFMSVCPNVKNACQRILDSYLLQEKLDKNQLNTDNALQSSANASVQLPDLNSFPCDESSSSDSIDSNAQQINCDELCSSVPEVSVEIEISNNCEQNDDSTNTISIGC